MARNSAHAAVQDSSPGQRSAGEGLAGEGLVVEAY